MKIEIKNIFTDEVIFSDERENNTIRLAVEKAVSLKINLSSADLRSANLSSANLRSANLSSADLRSTNLRSADLRSTNLSYADLRSTNLSYANLRSADLRYADLRSTNLSYADLRSADLRSANGNMEVVFSIQLEKWCVSFTSEILAIGCQQHTIKEWREFSDDRINLMDSSALAWWKKWKDFIFMAIDLSVNQTGE